MQFAAPTQAAAYLGDAVAMQNSGAPMQAAEGATAPSFGSCLQGLRPGGCRNGCAHGCCTCCPRWTVRADALALHRSASGNQTLLVDPQTQTELLNSAGLEFPYAVGPRLSLIRHDVCGYDIELSYFSIESWQSTADFPDGSMPGGFGYLLLDSSTVLPVSAVGFEERSRMYNGELNVRTPWSDCLTLIGGFRWADLYDYYTASGTEFSESSDFTHSVKAMNHMYGVQIGAELDLFKGGWQANRFGHTMLVYAPSSPFSLNAFIKSGIFYNWVDQSSSLTLRELWATGEDDHAAFLGEVGLNACYQVTEHLTLRAGYQVMWVEGVALAAKQIPVTDLGVGASVDTAGSLFYHGAVAGMELTW